MKTLNSSKEQYLICKCHALDDQYECECNRKPFAVTNDYKDFCLNTITDFNHYYEIYKITEKGGIKYLTNFGEILCDESFTDEETSYTDEEFIKALKEYEKDNVPVVQIGEGYYFTKNFYIDN